MYRSPVEHIINLLTYESCRICKSANGPLCVTCCEQLSSDETSRCYKCNKITKQNTVCRSCSSALRRVWWLGVYEGQLRELIGLLKYKRAREVGRQLGVGLAAKLPYLDAETLVVPVPTAPKRVRRRGYDQAQILARSLAAEKNLSAVNMLIRTTQNDQIGKRRNERLIQMNKAFRLKKNNLAGKTVLLVDDVLTTGATLESAARILRENSAAHVDAVVVARHLLK